MSRGHLVEIGGSYRLPDVMTVSGAILREVGTTNKTRISDYENAIDEDTAALMRVHTSNYVINGFTQEATLQELISLGREPWSPGDRRHRQRGAGRLLQVRHSRRTDGEG